MLKAVRNILFSLIVLLGVLILLSNHFPVNELPALGELRVIEKIDKDAYAIVAKSQADIFRGELILVNNETPYHFTYENKLVSLLEVKNSAYKVKDKSIEIDPCVIDPLNDMLLEFYHEHKDNSVTVISGYRTYEKQQALYNQKVSESGEIEAMKWVAKPGGSEHHTGYALDFGLFSNNGRSYEYNGRGKYNWINRNAYRYGFIIRYTEDKKDITGIENEPWHFRYVGKPHATIMTQYNMCMEEYIDYLKQFAFGKKHLGFIDYDGRQYEIYYADTLDVPVPKAFNYKISGNNIDGFIITVEKFSG
jgi:D-alanyl-D-alanine carboxypeptidase